jgi:hypothetical protein
MAVSFLDIHGQKTVNQPTRDVVCKFAHTQEERAEKFWQHYYNMGHQEG